MCERSRTLTSLRTGDMVVISALGNMTQINFSRDETAGRLLTCEGMDTKIIIPRLYSYAFAESLGELIAAVTNLKVAVAERRDLQLFLLISE